MMKQFCNIILLSIVLFILPSCKNERQENYYIIRSDDAPEYQYTYDKNGKRIPPSLEPCHTIIGGLYSRLVVLFDSIDNVYLYQTKRIKSKPLGCYDWYDRSKYQDYIFLKPEHLIHFDSNTFMSFIKDNNDILHLDTVSKDIRVIYLVCNTDTIKNPAFYELIKLIRTKNKHRKLVYYDVRKTTEEENYVLYCKKEKINYNPINFKWSKNSLMSKYLPNSIQYDSIENIRFDNIVRAIPTLSTEYTENE